MPTSGKPSKLALAIAATSRTPEVAAARPSDPTDHVFATGAKPDHPPPVPNAAWMGADTAPYCWAAMTGVLPANASRVVATLYGTATACGALATPGRTSISVVPTPL